MESVLLSAIILTKNEERNIADCVSSVLFCNEIVVIDDFSSDNTIAILKHFFSNKVRIFQRGLSGDFSAQRNFGISKTKGEWLLYIDADERVPERLENEITSVISNGVSLTNGFFIKRIDYLWGKEMTHGELGDISLLRLAKKNAGVWKGKVHEVWEVTGKTTKLSSPIIHIPHKSFGEFVSEVNFYSSLRAKELFDEKKEANWLSVVMYPAGKLFYNYFLRRGFLDGVEGLIFSLTMSFYSFLVRGKLWLLLQKEKSSQ